MLLIQIITFIFAFMKINLVSIFILAMSFISCKNQGGAIHAEYAGEDISGVAHILRDKQTKEASLTISASGSWKLFSGTSVETIDLSRPLLTGELPGLYPLQVSDSVRSYFQLVTDKGKAILAERHLPMTGGYNFRDLGGFRTTEGRYVKWGKIIRSDDLFHLTEADLHYLSSLPLVSIVDFRAESEIDHAPDKLPETTTGHYLYSISPGNLSSTKDINQVLLQNTKVMEQINVLLVSDTLNIKCYRDYFALLQNEMHQPLLFHCSAGKDRTGMAAALTLFALGVDEETIMADYLLSNAYLGDKYSEYTTKYPELKPLFEVKPEYLQAGLQYIKSKHGTVEFFLKKELNVNIEQLREMYLY